jgi:hypothetical protein
MPYAYDKAAQANVPDFALLLHQFSKEIRSCETSSFTLELNLVRFQTDFGWFTETQNKTLYLKICNCDFCFLLFSDSGTLLRLKIRKWRRVYFLKSFSGNLGGVLQ